MAKIEPLEDVFIQKILPNFPNMYKVEFTCQMAGFVPADNEKQARAYAHMFWNGLQEEGLFRGMRPERLLNIRVSGTGGEQYGNGNV